VVTVWSFTQYTLGSNFGPKPVLATAVLHGISRSRQKDTRLLSGVGHDRFLPIHSPATDALWSEVLVFFFTMAQRRQWPPHCRGFMITLRHTTRWDSSGRVIRRTQRPLPDNTEYSQQTGIRAPRRDSNHNHRERAVIDPCLKRRSHWDRRGTYIRIVK